MSAWRDILALRSLSARFRFRRRSLHLVHPCTNVWAGVLSSIPTPSLPPCPSFICTSVCFSASQERGLVKPTIKSKTITKYTPSIGALRSDTARSASHLRSRNSAVRRDAPDRRAAEQQQHVEHPQQKRGGHHPLLRSRSLDRHHHRRVADAAAAAATTAPAAAATAATIRRTRVAGPPRTLHRCATHSPGCGAATSRSQIVGSVCSLWRSFDTWLEGSL